MAERVKKESSAPIKAGPVPLTLDHLSSRNEEMQKCLELARAASQTTASVLILAILALNVLAYGFMHRFAARGR